MYHSADISTRVNIALITNRYYPAIGGNESFLKQFAEFLVNCGHSVTVYCSFFKDTNSSDTYDQGEERINNVRVIRLQAIRLFGKDALTIVYPLIFMKDLTKKYDLIHTFTYGYSTSWIPALRKLSSAIKAPIIFSPQYNGTPNFPRWITTFYDLTLGKISINQANKIVLETEIFKSLFGKNVSIIPPAVETLIFPQGEDEITSWKKLNGISENKKILLSIGRVSKEKGIHYLLDAILSDKNYGREYVLVIAGDGPYLNEAKNTVKSYLNDKTKVYFVGQLVGKEKGLAFAAADAFISLSKAESFGITIIEAMQARLPLILADIPIFRYLGGKSAIYVTNTEVDSIHTAIQAAFLRKKELYPNINQYSVDTIAQQYLSLYSEVVGESR